MNIDIDVDLSLGKAQIQALTEVPAEALQSIDPPHRFLCHRQI